MQHRLRKSFETTAVLSRSRSFKYPPTPPGRKGQRAFTAQLQSAHTSLKRFDLLDSFYSAELCCCFLTLVNRVQLQNLVTVTFGFSGFSFSRFHFGSNFGSNPTDIAAWHRLAWSGMLGAAVILFPTCTLTLQAHQQLLALLRAAHLQGCHVYFEYPAGGLGEVQGLYIQLCQELASHCAQARLWKDKHSIIICSTDSLVSTLASQDDGLGTLSGIASKHCTSILQAPIGADALIKHMPSCYLPKRPAVCDGAGMFSTADHSANNTSTGPKPLAQLARSFKHYLASHGLVKHISNHLSEGRDEPPLSEEHGIASIHHT